MTSRTRTQDFGSNYGTWTYGQTVREYYTVMGTRKCVDVPDNFGGENPFSLTITDEVVGVLNGLAGGGFFKNVPLTLYECSKHVDTAPVPSSFSAKILASTSPSAPSLPLLVSLFELRELKKSIVKDLANIRSLFRRSSFASKRTAVSDLFLSKEMGWRPLISDVKKLLDLRSAANSRLREFETLSTGGVLRKQCHLQTIQTVGDWSATKTQHSSLSCYINVKYRDTTDRQVWGSAKWEPSSSFPESFRFLTLKQKEAAAIRSALGLQSDQLSYSIWQALPWSWLVDWVDSFSDTIIASNNTVAHASNGVCCVMQHATTKREFQVVSKPPGITISRHSSTYESKSRVVVEASASEVTAPFINKRRLSVLAALVSQRVR